MEINLDIDEIATEIKSKDLTREDVLELMGAIAYTSSDWEHLTLAIVNIAKCEMDYFTVEELVEDLTNISKELNK